MRDTYCEAMEAYTGSPYIWGGEGIGTDCFSAQRKGFEDALATRGTFTFNPAQVRESTCTGDDTTAQVIGVGQTAPVDDRLLA